MKRWTVLSLTLLIMISACGPSEAEKQATVTQLEAELSGTETAQAMNHAATLTAAAPTNTPTATYTPEPTATSTPLPLGKLSGKVFWLEGGGPVAARLYLRAVEGGKGQESTVSTNGKYSFEDVEPGTYMFEFQITFDNPVFGPCSGMSFNAGAEGISYSLKIINGEYAWVTGKSEPFSIAAGDLLETDIPFSFTCQ